MNAMEHLKAVITGGAWCSRIYKTPYCKSCNRNLPSVTRAWYELEPHELSDPHKDDCEIGNAIKFLQEQGEL